MRATPHYCHELWTVSYTHADDLEIDCQNHVCVAAGGVVDCARKTIQWEGITGLYKGVAAPLAGQMFFRATLFSALGSSKRWLSTDADGNRRQLTMLDCYKAGAMAGGAAAFFEGPIDFYKSQVCTNTHLVAGTVHQLTTEH